MHQREEGCFQDLHQCVLAMVIKHIHTEQFIFKGMAGLTLCTIFDPIYLFRAVKHKGDWLFIVLLDIEDRHW